jgi:uncharacterized OB-fold protein
MSTRAERPIADGLFTWPAAEPRLIGSRCADCGRATFPAQSSCPACCSTAVHREELPPTGTLWSWTIQRFMPKTPYRSGETPESFRPFGVGYVELPGAVCVEGRLTENEPAKLAIGMPMEVVFAPWRTEPDGTTIINFAFRPA